MIAVSVNGCFESWRSAVRGLLEAGVPPEDVLWCAEDQPALFDTPVPAHKRTVRVPKSYVDAAGLVALHRDNGKWALMYRVLYRLTQGEPHLLHIASDPDVHALEAKRREVAHDIHRMHAFVRFREVDGRYVAWYEPDHLIVEAAAPWFAERFGAMAWSILTPDRCAHWDTRELTYTDGALRRNAPEGDPLEELWRAYYASTFNPARTNLPLLRSHMPLRKWRNLPEAQVIENLTREAAGRCGSMAAEAPVTAAAFIPAGAPLPVLREAIEACRGCDLHRNATHPVFGEGPENASIVLVGEQPGDNEDREGRAFIGPSGQLLNRALADAGLVREQLYITGAVKHFRYEERGKRRIHKTASRAQVAACQPWLEAQLNVIRPRLIVCMGNTAVLSVLGRGVRLMEERGRVVPHRFAQGAMVTVHPGFLLRIPDTARQEREYELFVNDLRTAKEYASAA